MLNTKFEAYKLQRELKKIGKVYELKRSKLNTFKEPIKGEEETIGNLLGLYHERNSNVSIVTGDTTQIRLKKIPMLLCLYEDAKKLNPKIGDIIEINSKIFHVIGIADIQEWNVIADISLEVVDDGVRA